MSTGSKKPHLLDGGPLSKITRNAPSSFAPVEKAANMLAELMAGLATLKSSSAQTLLPILTRLSFILVDLRKKRLDKAKTDAISQSAKKDMKDLEQAIEQLIRDVLEDNVNMPRARATVKKAYEVIGPSERLELLEEMLEKVNRSLGKKAMPRTGPKKAAGKKAGGRKLAKAPRHTKKAAGKKKAPAKKKGAAKKKSEGKP